MSNNWISVETAMPVSGVRVLFLWSNGLDKARTSAGQYNAKYTEEANDLDCEDTEYDDVTDENYLAEGWQEWGWETEYSAYVTGVTHWQPLPRPPEPSDNCIVALRDLSANY